MKDKVVLEKDYRKNSESIDQINQKISELIITIQSNFNPNWGELMRSGAEESRFADQLEKYSCIYMESVADLLAYGQSSTSDLLNATFHMKFNKI